MRPDFAEAAPRIIHWRAIWSSGCNRLTRFSFDRTARDREALVEPSSECCRLRGTADRGSWCRERSSGHRDGTRQENAGRRRPVATFAHPCPPFKRIALKGASSWHARMSGNGGLGFLQSALSSSSPRSDVFTCASNLLLMLPSRAATQSGEAPPQLTLTGAGPIPAPSWWRPR